MAPKWGSPLIPLTGVSTYPVYGYHKYPCVTREQAKAVPNPGVVIAG